MDEQMINDAINTPSTVTAGKSKYPEWVPMSEGEHFGHIVKADTRKVTWEKEGVDYEATVYNFFVEIAPENAQNQFVVKMNGADVTKDGSHYAGKKIKAKGVFRITKPSNDANTQYTRFCEDLNLPLVDKQAVVDGKEVTIKELPELTTDFMEGKPVTAVVKEGKPWTNKDGEQKKGWEVKFIKAWADGKQKEAVAEKPVSDDDLPF